MIDVYWSPWVSADIYDGMNMVYEDIYPLSRYYNTLMEKRNIHDNFLKCPAHVNYTKNIYCLPQPFEINAVIDRDRITDIATNKASNLNHFYEIKSPSLLDSCTININSSWIFFCEKSLVVESMPAFMHNTGLSKGGFYVPGTFDISKWFRPLDAAIQLWNNTTSISCNRGDPLFYIKFLTDEKINLKRFNLTQDIRNIANGCVQVKRYTTIKNLDKLYQMFTGRGKHKQLLKLIKENSV